VLFIVARDGPGDDAEIAVADAAGAHHLLGLRAIHVRYAESGHVVYVTADGTLMAAAFDQDQLAVTGEGRAIAEGLRVGPQGSVDLALSSSGTMAYSTRSDTTGPDQVVWIDRDGRASPGDRWTADFADLALSPDGTRMVVGIRVASTVELWVREGERGPLSRLTSAVDGNSEEPAWTPDGRSVAYISGTGANQGVYVRRADGSAPAALLVRWGGTRRPADIAWTPDGKTLVVEAGADLYRIRPGVDSTPTPLLPTRFSGGSAAVSPDGRWLAYSSNESGRPEVYVRPFADPGDSRKRVSTAGGIDPGWSSSGRELFFVRRRGRSGSEADMLSVEVGNAAAFTHGPERVLFFSPGISYWSTTPDAKRFVVVQAAATGERVRAQVVVVENWFEELKSAAIRR
jgi:serine/threonine-protein kinase